MVALLSIPIASYYSIVRLALINFSYAQQNHKLNESGITRKGLLIREQVSECLSYLNSRGCDERVVVPVNVLLY
jgi:hypothetical protein